MVTLLVQAGLFDTAISLCQTFKLPLTPVFEGLAFKYVWNSFYSLNFLMQRYHTCLFVAWCEAVSHEPVSYKPTFLREGHPQHVDIPGAGKEPVPQWWRFRILNLLHHKGTPICSLLWHLSLSDLYHDIYCIGLYSENSMRVRSVSYSPLTFL